MNDFHNLEYLDTSFVKLDALVRYLCRRGFVGSINLKFDGYRAEITVTSAGKLRVSEFDSVGMNVGSGPTAFTSVISKAQTSGGIIEVFWAKADDFESRNRANTATEMIDTEQECSSKLICHVKIDPDKRASDSGARRSLSQLAGFPFELTNHFEDEAASPTDREVRLETMIDVTSDLLSTIDDALGQAGLDFGIAFQKACADVSGKYPFLQPEKRLFRYSNGFVYISPDIHLRSLAAGLGDVLARIFHRLAANAKLDEVYRSAFQKVQLLVTTRKEEFTSTGMGRQVERGLKHPRS